MDGFPQTNLFRSFAPAVGPGIWLVGDSIFLGQSLAVIALGGLRVAGLVLRRLGCKPHLPAARRGTPSSSPK